MDNKTTFGFESTRFIIWGGIVKGFIHAAENSLWCLEASKAAVNTWVSTYRALKSTEPDFTRTRSLPKRRIQIAKELSKEVA